MMWSHSEDEGTNRIMGKKTPSPCILWRIIGQCAGWAGLRDVGIQALVALTWYLNKASLAAFYLVIPINQRKSALEVGGSCVPKLF